MKATQLLHSLGQSIWLDNAGVATSMERLQAAVQRTQLTRA